MGKQGKVGGGSAAGWAGTRGPVDRRIRKTQQAHGLGFFFFFFQNSVKREAPPAAAASQIHLKSSVDSVQGSVGAANANQVYNHQLGTREGGVWGRPEGETSTSRFVCTHHTRAHANTRTHAHAHAHKGKEGARDRRSAAK